MRSRSIGTCLLIGLFFTSPLIAQERKSDTPAGATTYQDVLQLLKMGIDEDAILRKLEKSPTTFVLSEDQLKELQAAGASKCIIAAMQGTRGTNGAADSIS